MKYNHKWINFTSTAVWRLCSLWKDPEVSKFPRPQLSCSLKYRLDIIKIVRHSKFKPIPAVYVNLYNDNKSAQ